MPSGLDAAQALAEPTSHALREPRRQYFRVPAASIRLEEVRKCLIHRRSDRGEHRVSALNVGPLTKENALLPFAPAFAVEVLPDRGSNVQFRRVHLQDVD